MCETLQRSFKAQDEVTLFFERIYFRFFQISRLRADQNPTEDGDDFDLGFSGLENCSFLGIAGSSAQHLSASLPGFYFCICNFPVRKSSSRCRAYLPQLLSSSRS